MMPVISFLLTMLISMSLWMLLLLDSLSAIGEKHAAQQKQSRC
jgi:hypothetical protein